MKKTKIICSIGPASSDEKVLEKMIESGMNVARFNMSHGTHESHKLLIDAVKKARENLHAPVGIMIDTKGPEIRVKQFENSNVFLTNGAQFVLTTNQMLGNEKMVSVTYNKLPKILKKGTKILLNDGNIELKVEKTTKTDVICTVVNGGELSNNKSINLPDVKTEMVYLSEQDKSDIAFAKEMGADFLAISFVNCPEDVLSVKEYLNEIKFKHVKIISKIESNEGVKNFDKILKVSDGIMVARGDLGVEIDFVKIPILQKEFISKCNHCGKIVVTATQMLESMITNPRPTRAEISDVANAIFDGSTAIMLSGETAAGKHPVEVVETMKRIAIESENYISGVDRKIEAKNTSKCLGYAVYAMSQTKNIEAIVVATQSGKSAENISSYRPQVPIVACTPNEKIFNKLSIFYGVYPVLDSSYKTLAELKASTLEKTLKTNLVKKGDKVVYVCGQTAGKSGTNSMTIEKI